MNMLFLTFLGTILILMIVFVDPIADFLTHLSLKIARKVASFFPEKHKELVMHCTVLIFLGVFVFGVIGTTIYIVHGDL